MVWERVRRIKRGKWGGDGDIWRRMEIQWFDWFVVTERVSVRQFKDAPKPHVSFGDTARIKKPLIQYIKTVKLKSHRKRVFNPKILMTTYMWNCGHLFCFLQQPLWWDHWRCHLFCCRGKKKCRVPLERWERFGLRLRCRRSSEMMKNVKMPFGIKGCQLEMDLPISFATVAFPRNCINETIYY